MGSDLVTDPQSAATYAPEPQFNEMHVRRFYRFLGHDTFSDLRCVDVTQGRILKREIIQGEDEVVRFARQYNGRGNVFIGRNPRDASGNPSAITIASFDIDPIRPKGAASTDLQLRGALLGGTRILSLFPGGLLGCSGNGALLAYRTEHVRDSNQFKSYERGLQAMATRIQACLDDLGVKVDATHDSSRMVKLLGTWSCKGDRADRRISRIISVPLSTGVCGPVSREIMSHQSNPGILPGHDIRPPQPVKTTHTLSNGERLKAAEQALKRLAPTRCETYDTWLKVGMALKEFGLAGFSLWDQWSRKSPKYSEGDTWAKWQTFSESGDLTVGTIIHWANEDTGPEQSVHVGAVEFQPGRKFSEFIKTEGVKTEWICEPFVGERAIGFIAGLPKTSKTWLTIDLAIEAARGGGKWCGLFPVKGAKVLFVDQERFEGETQRRFKALVGAKNIDPSVLDATLDIRCGKVVKLDDPQSLQAFRRYVADTKPTLIVIDSFITTHSTNENDRTAMQQVMESIKAVRRDFGCSIVFVDHDVKSSYQDAQNNIAPSANSMAGTVGKSAAAEFVLTVKRVDARTSAVYHTASTLASAAEPFTISVEDTTSGIIVKGAGEDSYGRD